jgi:hypothetical protein
MIKKIKEHFEVITLVLLLIVFIRQCGTSNDLSKIRKDTKSINSEINSIKENTFTKDELSILLKISGLEAEKRMIQATDRKILDVNRQSEIEKDVQNLNRDLQNLQNPKNKK